MQSRRSLFGISIPSVQPLRSLCALSLAGMMLTAGAHGAGAQGTDRYAFALQDNEFCEVMDAVGTPVGATPEGFAVEASTPETSTPEGTPVGDLADDIGDIGMLDANVEGALCQDVDGDGINEIGIDEDESGTLEENEVLGSDLDNDQALTNELTYPFADVAATDAGALDDDGVFDADNEGYLREDIDDDGVWEIGVDEDESGTLEENEVLGSDLNEDEALTNEFNNGTGAGDDGTGGARTVDFATYAGDDNTFDANDEGYLSDDVDGDGSNEIGVDEDESGTLDENEVLGTDENNDEALTEDEVED